MVLLGWIRTGSDMIFKKFADQDWIGLIFFDTGLGSDFNIFSSLQAGTLHSGTPKSSVTNPCFRKQGATLAAFVLCYQNNFATLKLCH